MKSRILACLRAATLLLIMSVALQSCQNKATLFRSKTHEDYYKSRRKERLPVVKLKPESDQAEYYRYKINPGDELRIRFLNLPPELAEESFEIKSDEKYIVSTDGYITPPLSGRIFVAGKSTDEVQKVLVSAFSDYFPSPSIEVAVTNLKIFVMGEVQLQGVITLPTERTHLIEALALAGGVPRTAKMNKVKIIRGELDNPQVIWVDLQQIESLEDDALYMRSGDVVVLEPRNLLVIVRELQPYSSLLNVLTLLPTFYFFLRTAGII